MSITLPNIALKGDFVDGVDDWGADMNANLLKLAVLVQAGILSRVAAVPADPVEGAVYVLTAAPNANAVAAYHGAAWAYFLPSEGWLVYDRGADTHISFNGNAWVPFTGGGGGEGLPAGGTTGQVLGKLSNADGDADWIDQTGEGGGGGGGSNSQIKNTRLTLAANVPVPTGSWKLIPWALKDDTAGAFDAATPTDVTVPAGMTVARITGRVGWADGGSTRAIHCVGGDGRTLALDIRSGASESGSSVSSGGWVAVTPGEKITLQANSFASASSILGGNTFGGLPQFQFEWAPSIAAATSGGGGSAFRGARVFAGEGGGAPGASYNIFSSGGVPSVAFDVGSFWDAANARFKIPAGVKFVEALVFVDERYGNNYATHIRYSQNGVLRNMYGSGVTTLRGQLSSGPIAVQEGDWVEARVYLNSTTSWTNDTFATIHDIS